MKKKCALCGKPLPPVAILHNDPYCSTVCARKMFGAANGEKQA